MRDRRFVIADLLRRDDEVKWNTKRPLRLREQIVITVCENREFVAALAEARQRIFDIWEHRERSPLLHERIHLWATESNSNLTRRARQRFA